MALVARSLCCFGLRKARRELRPVKGLAETTQRLKDELAGRMEVVTSASILMNFLMLVNQSSVSMETPPGGQIGSVYICLKARIALSIRLMRRNPIALRVSSTGQSAII